MNTQGFELLPHTADVRIRAWGKTIKELFRNAERGIAALMKPAALAAGEKTKKVTHAIRVEAIDINTLLVEFLSRILELSDINNSIYTNITFKAIGENFLEGELSGVTTDGFDQEIKAVSYQDVDVKRNPESGLYETMLICDI